MDITKEGHEDHQVRILIKDPGETKLRTNSLMQHEESEEIKMLGD